MKLSWTVPAAAAVDAGIDAAGSREAEYDPATITPALRAILGPWTTVEGVTILPTNPAVSDLQRGWNQALLQDDPIPTLEETLVANRHRAMVEAAHQARRRRERADAVARNATEAQQAAAEKAAAEAEEAYVALQRAEQAYVALQRAVERIMGGVYLAALKKHKKRPGSRVPYQVPAEVDILIEASPDVLGGKITPEEAMAILWHPDVWKRRLQS